MKKLYALPLGARSDTTYCRTSGTSCFLLCPLKSLRTQGLSDEERVKQQGSCGTVKFQDVKGVWPICYSSPIRRGGHRTPQQEVSRASLCKVRRRCWGMNQAAINSQRKIRMETADLWILVPPLPHEVCLLNGSKLETAIWFEVTCFTSANVVKWDQNVLLGNIEWQKHLEPWLQDCWKCQSERIVTARKQQRLTQHNSRLIFYHSFLLSSVFTLFCLFPSSILFFCSERLFRLWYIFIFLHKNPGLHSLQISFKVLSKNDNIWQWNIFIFLS